MERAIHRPPEESGDNRDLPNMRRKSQGIAHSVLRGRHLEIYFRYRVAILVMHLSWDDLDLESSPGWWAVTEAIFCPSRIVEHPKDKLLNDWTIGVATL